MPKYKYECNPPCDSRKESDLLFPPFCQKCHKLMHRAPASSVTQEQEVRMTAAPRSGSPLTAAFAKPVGPAVKPAAAHPSVAPLPKPVAPLVAAPAVRAAPVPSIADIHAEFSLEKLSCFSNTGHDKDLETKVDALFRGDRLLARSIKTDELGYYTDPPADWKSHGLSFTLISPKLPQYLFGMGEGIAQRVLGVLVDSQSMTDRILQWSSIDAAFNPNVHDIDKLIEANKGKDIGKELQALVKELKAKQKPNAATVEINDIRTGQIKADALVGLIFCPRINPFKAESVAQTLNGLAGSKTVALPVFDYFVHGGGARLRYTCYRLRTRK